jgi:general secretion pathway protein G
MTQAPCAVDRAQTRTHVARRQAGEGGWTLIELLTVISIILILAAMALVGYRNSVTGAKEAVLKEDLFRMRDAIDQYYADKTGYPASLDDLVSAGYMREVPQDPFTRSRDSWQSVLAEPDPSSPTATVGIYDVKSGFEGTALDGTRYAEW